MQPVGAGPACPTSSEQCKLPETAGREHREVLPPPGAEGDGNPFPTHHREPDTHPQLRPALHLPQIQAALERSALGALPSLIT